MSLQPGTRLGPYEIVAPIGAGGMGEVYRARDTQLKRDVALKVLPAALATDADRLARFQREAELLAALNHPNIAHIHGLVDTDGVRALVMELVEGPTLAERIKTGPIPLDEALPIARQIAEALEAAHERGIIHRDLKPANIKVKDDGTVKVLDFGLAKAMTPDLSSAAADDLANSPTLTARATQMGVVLGTAAYMSPEQARGKPIDKRTDIWAFGVVLYEMLVGARPFQGESVTEALAAVLRGEPDWSALPLLPQPFLVFMHRCLEKDRTRRIVNAAVARFALDELFLDTEPPEAQAVAPSAAPTWIRLLTAVGAVGVGALLTWLTLSVVIPDRDMPGVARLSMSPLPEEALRDGDGNVRLSISPDGTRVVYESRRGLLARSLADSKATVLVPRRASAPFFSPDGRWVGFFDSNIAIAKVPVTGGSPIRLAPLGGGLARGASWAEDGTIVFATTASSGLVLMSADDGGQVVLTTPNRALGEGDHLWPQFLPGGGALLFTIVPDSGGLEGAQVAVLDMASRNYKIVVRGGAYGRYLPTGHLIYVAAGVLRAVPFDLAARQVAATPAVPVMSEVSVAPSGAPEFAFANNGTLIYVEGGSDIPRRRLVWVDRESNREELLKAPPRSYLYPRLSPDGERVALDIRDQQSDIWMWNVAGNTLSRLTTEPSLERYPLWTRDGQRVVFSSDRDGTSNVFSQAAAGDQIADRLFQSDDSLAPMAVLRDNRIVARDGSGHLLILLLNDDTPPVRLLEVRSTIGSATVSPDERWLAYSSDETGVLEVYVRPFPDVNRGADPVSPAGGSQPAWSRDGRELFFFSGSGELVGTRVGNGPTWSHGPLSVVVKAGYKLGNPAAAASYDVSEDGKRFLMIKRGDGAGGSDASIQVVLNWFEELKRLVPVK